MQEIKIEGNIDIRIDSYLAECLDESRSKILKMLKDGSILVNGKEVKPSYCLRENDIVSIKEFEVEMMSAEPEKMDLDIVYEDDDVIVVNKANGVVVHPAVGNNSGTLVNGLLYHAKELSSINGEFRPGIVHRIDMDTTGSIVICKNDFAHQHIAAQLKEHSIRRIYHAIVHGVIKEDEGTVDAPIGRHPIDRKKMSINHKNGKEAVTHYKVIQRFQNYTYIQCQLETGRTHQIRVHMSSIKHPLLGDAVYGPAKCPFKLQGQTLHAKIIGIIHPRTDCYIEADAPLPEYFKKLLEKLEQIG